MACGEGRAMNGPFITFEGGEGSGKSTQMALVAERFRQAGVSVRFLREPGGTAVGEAVRRILLDPAGEGMDPRAELLLYEASRAQLVAEVIRPAIASGTVVLCDRFADSSTAYQGHARGLGVESVRAMNVAATGGLVPDRTLLFDIDPRIGLERATTGGADRIEAESLAFHQRVREGFLDIADGEPERVRVIDASGSVEQVAERTIAALRDLACFASVLGGAE